MKFLMKVTDPLKESGGTQSMGGGMEETKIGHRSCEDQFTKLSIHKGRYSKRGKKEQGNYGQKTTKMALVSTTHKYFN